VIGPYVSIGEQTQINNSIISNSIIQSNSKISNHNFENSMIGHFVELEGKSEDLNIGDYCKLK
jgi:glucose-1-phosphate thymidylyltransferase